MVDIFVFKFRQKFEIITRIGMYFSLFYIFGFEGYKEVNQFWKSLAFFTFVISFLSILYYLYFVIDFKKKEFEKKLDDFLKEFKNSFEVLVLGRKRIRKTYFTNHEVEYIKKINNKEVQ